MHQRRKLTDTSLSNTGEINHSKRNRNQISHNNTDQDRSQFPDSFSKMVQCRNNDQGKKCDRPVLPGTIIWITGTTRHIVDGCRIQGKTDGKYNGSCDQRWEKYTNLLHQKTHDYSNDTTYNLSSHDCCDPIGLRYRLHTRYIGETYTHNNRQTGTDGKLCFTTDWK